MNTRTWSLYLRRLSTVWLLGLLALGPYLHAHFGHASTQGFHVDGLQWHSHLQDTENLSFTSDDEHEAPAVGISASLTRESHDAPASQDLIAWACTVVLAVLPTVIVRSVPACPAPLAPPASAYRLAGHPPPSLAPPALT